MADLRTPNPTPLNYDATGVAAPSGAIVFPSGTTVDLSGPWFIEEQEMTIQYTRVPAATLSSTDIKLAGVSTFGWSPVANTKLLADVQATYTARKDYTTYSTSGFQTPQTFSVLALSSDPYGNSYGALTASTLGPMGSIITSQKYYRRVPWDDVLHVSASESCNAVDYLAKIDNASSAPFHTLAAPLKNNFDHSFVRATHGGTAINDQEGTIYGGNIPLAGEYSTSGETQLPSSYIDYIGNKVTGEEFWTDPYEPDNGQGCPSYLISRHDYS